MPEIAGIALATQKFSLGVIIVIELIGTLILNTSAGLLSNQIIHSNGTIIATNPNLNQPSSSLHTEGNLIKDSQGNTVFLKGVNFQGYEYGDFNSHSEEDYARISSWGFNVVRLPIAWQYVESEPGVYNESFLARLDNDLMWASKYNLYVILDMHQFNWSSHWNGGMGMPLWMVNYYPTNDDGMQQAITDFYMGKGPNGTAPTQENPSMEDRFIACWTFLASRYKDYPGVMFDLLNEPPTSNSLGGVGTSNLLSSFFERLIYDIRKVDKNHILIYEPADNGGNTQLTTRINGTNLAISFHFYDYSENYNGNSTLLEKAISGRLRQPIGNPITSWQMPIIVGEFGVKQDASNYTLWLQKTLELFNREGLDNWMWWTYGRSDEYKRTLLYQNGTERNDLLQYLIQAE